MHIENTLGNKIYIQARREVTAFLRHAA